MKTSYFIPALAFTTLLPAQAIVASSEADELMSDLASFTDAKPLPALEAGQAVRAQFSVVKGNDVLLYRKTETPEFAKEAVAAAKVAVLSDSVTSSSLEEAAPSQFEEPANINYLSVSTVVHGVGVTEIKWSTDTGVQKRVMFRGSLEFLPFSVSVNDGERSHYVSVMNWGDGFFGEIKSLNEYPQYMRGVLGKGLEAPKGAFVQVVAEDGKLVALTPAETSALDALIAFYAVHETDLAKQHAENVARAERYAEAKRVYDEMPKTYEIRIWKTPVE